MLIFVLANLVFQKPLLLLLSASVAAGVWMLLVFRYVSEPKKIRCAKDQLQAQFMAVRLFQSQPSAVMRAYGRLLRNAARYLGTLVKPTLIVVIVLVPSIGWLEPYFEWQPLRPKEAFLLKVGLDDRASVNNVTLQLPAGIWRSAPAVHIPSEQQVVWRLVARRDGTFPVRILCNGFVLVKPVVAAAGVRRISAFSLHRAFWERWLHQGTVSLPSGTPIRSIEIVYRPREINLWLLQANWIIVFFVSAIGSALLLKHAFGVEI